MCSSLLICFPSLSFCVSRSSSLSSTCLLLLLLAEMLLCSLPEGQLARTLGATPKGVGRRTRKEQPNRTSQDRTGHRTQQTEWNGTERNRTKPRPNQTRLRQTEPNRTEHRPVECIKCWPKLQPTHISHESVCQVRSPDPHNNNNDNPPCGAHSVCADNDEVLTNVLRDLRLVDFHFRQWFFSVLLLIYSTVVSPPSTSSLSPHLPQLSFDNASSFSSSAFRKDREVLCKTNVLLIGKRLSFSLCLHF